MIVCKIILCHFVQEGKCSGYQLG